MDSTRFEQRRLALQAAIGDRLIILGCIGGGGMAQVFLGQHKVHGGLLAIKVLSESLAGDPRIVERFRMEAKTAALLTGHPNIVPIFDVEVNESTGLCYITMQYIAGEDMSSFLKRAGRIQPAAAAMNILAQVAEALDCAGASHIVHRDLKPANIRLDRYGRAIVLDFGIAKAASATTDGLTRVGETLGTPFYMCPEQIQELPCDARSDLYSLGCVLFEMLTGRRPFQPYEDSFHSVLSAHLSAPVPSALELDPAIPPVFASVAEKLMRKNPDLRFQSPRELLDALHALGINSGPGELRPQPDLDTEAWIAAHTPAAGSPQKAAAKQSAVVSDQSSAVEPSRILHPEITDTPPGSELTALFAGAPTRATAITSEPSQLADVPQSIESSSGRSSPPGDRRPATGNLPNWLWIMSAIVIVAGTGTVASLMIRRQHRTPISASGTQQTHRTSGSIPPSAQPPAVEDDHGKMVLVPAGRFVFGDNTPDSEALLKMPESHTNPMRDDVDLRAFYIDETEVSNGEYKKFCDAKGSAAPPSCQSLGNPTYPVVNVSLADARAYASWAGKRLPTEEEWEKAARGTKGQLYPWGDDPWTDAPDAIQSVNFKGKPGSPFGALNMAGNVFEWTETTYPKAEGEYADTQQKLGHTISRDWFVIKGGAFSASRKFEKFFRADLHSGWPSDQGLPTLGFRCVRDPVPAPSPN